MQTKITYRHFGSNCFDPMRFVPITNDPVRSKPYGGLWASRVDSDYGWWDFCQNQRYELGSLRTHFDFMIQEGARVHTIRTMDDIKMLPMRDNPMPAIYGPYLPDFVECLRQGIDAVELLWYDSRFHTEESGPVGRALRTWDCDSIVILNPKMIIPIEKED